MAKDFVTMQKSIDVKTGDPQRIGKYLAAMLLLLAAMMVHSIPASSQITDSHGDAFELSSRGQVLKCNTTGCTALTGSNTFTSQLVATGNRTSNVTLYMVANNGAANQVWQYTGSGTVWTPITGPGTTVTSIVATSNDLYMLAHNGAANHVWHYSGSSANWIPITGSNTTVFSISLSGNDLTMFASNDGEEATTWVYTGSGTVWTPLPVIQ